VGEGACGRGRQYRRREGRVTESSVGCWIQAREGSQPTGGPCCIPDTKPPRRPTLERRTARSVGQNGESAGESPTRRAWNANTGRESARPPPLGKRWGRRRCASGWSAWRAPPIRRTGLCGAGTISVRPSSRSSTSSPIPMPPPRGSASRFPPRHADCAPPRFPPRPCWRRRTISPVPSRRLARRGEAASSPRIDPRRSRCFAAPATS
jgi:hypothetical protein